MICISCERLVRLAGKILSACVPKKSAEGDYRSPEAKGPGVFGRSEDVLRGSDVDWDHLLLRAVGPSVRPR